MEAEDYNCSFCRMAYSDPTDIVVDPGSGSAICVECFHTGAEEFSGKRAGAKLPPKAPCLICLQRIEAEGSDPCHVRVTSDDGRRGTHIPPVSRPHFIRIHSGHSGARKAVIVP
jgi:hypothetical protein